MQEAKQSGTNMDIKNKDVLDLLKFNYQNLHQSVWSNHQTTWTVTGIFMSALTVMLGYLVKEFWKFSELQVATGFCITEVLLVVWLLLTRTFEHYNNMRMWRLKNIEDVFNEIISGEMKEYFCLKDILHNTQNRKKFLKYLVTAGHIVKLSDKALDSVILILDPDGKKIEIRSGDKLMAAGGIENDVLAISNDKIRIGKVKKENGTLNIYERCFDQYGLDYRKKLKQFKFSPMNIYYAFFYAYTILNIFLLIYKFNAS